MGFQLLGPTLYPQDPPYDAATLAVINNMTQSPTFGQKLAIKALVEALENSGAWANLSILSIFNAQTTQAALINWKNPSGGAIWTPTSSPTFTAFQGYAGNGTSAFLLGPTWTTIAGLSPAYAQNNASTALWQGTNVAPAANNFCGGVNAAGQPYLYLSQDANKLSNFRLNDTTSDLLPCPYGVNVIGATRNSSTTVNYWVNKQKHIITRASTGTPTGTNAITMLAAGGSTFSSGTICAMMLGVFLTDAQYLAAVQAVQSYIDTMSGGSSQVPSFWGVDGAWSWFNTPRVIKVNGTDVLSTTSNVGGTVVVSNPTGTPPVRSLIVPSTTYGQDDHTGGAIIQLPSAGKIVSMAPPDEGTTFRNALSANANDATTFAANTDIYATLTAGGLSKLTNANLFLLSATSTIWAFIRAFAADGITETQYYTTSTDGATWAGLARLLWTARPYLLGVVNGTNRIDFVLSTGNPGDGVYGVNNIYHLVYNAGTWQNSAGTSLGSPPFTAGATQTFTQNASNNFLNGDTVTIGSRVYTFQTSLTAVDGHVNIGANFAASVVNLIHAINNVGGVPGTDYFVTQADPNVTAGSETATTFYALAYGNIPAATANAIVTSYAATGTSAGSWGAGTLAGANSTPTVVYASAGSQDLAWQWDIQLDPVSSNPIIVFSTGGYTAVANNNDITDHTYKQARWSGTAWSVSTICDGGGTIYPRGNKGSQPHYVGGMCMDPTNPNIVYASVQVNSAGAVDYLNGVHQIFKFVLANGKWTSTQLTFDQNNLNFRPYIIPNACGNGGAGAAANLYFVKGSYTTFQNYATVIASLPITLGS